MPYFFGMYIKSKEDREKEYQEYFKSIFPYGEKQKAAVESLLKELVPKENLTILLLYFIQLKEQMLSDRSLSPYEADQALSKKTQRPRSLDSRPRILALLDADTKIDESLSYPSAQELIRRAESFPGPHIG